MATTADPATVPGLPESTLKPEDLAALPAGVPLAPWECRIRAVIWVQRAAPPSFGWLGRPTRLAMVALVEYLDSPVGTYHEVLAGNLVRSGLAARLQVPFIAVDSLASVAGGRVNWALPKTVAGFETDLERASARAEGDGWSVTVRPAWPARAARAARAAARPNGAAQPDRAAQPEDAARPSGTAQQDRTPRPDPTAQRLPGWIPMRSRFSSIGPLGSYPARLRATGRILRVQTQVEGETLTGWLGSGSHLAVLLTGRMQVGEPRPTRA
jgi:hypothetical protein